MQGAGSRRTSRTGTYGEEPTGPRNDAAEDVLWELLLYEWDQRHNTRTLDRLRKLALVRHTDT